VISQQPLYQSIAVGVRRVSHPTDQSHSHVLAVDATTCVIGLHPAQPAAHPVDVPFIEPNMGGKDPVAQEWDALRRILTQKLHPSQRALATRNPLLLSEFVGCLLLRYAERALYALLFHEPPRNTRAEQ
jgi:hypothetical protein